MQFLKWVLNSLQSFNIFCAFFCSHIKTYSCLCFCPNPLVSWDELSVVWGLSRTFEVPGRNVWTFSSRVGLAYGLRTYNRPTGDQGPSAPTWSRAPVGGGLGGDSRRDLSSTRGRKSPRTPAKTSIRVSTSSSIVYPKRVCKVCWGRARLTKPYVPFHARAHLSITRVTCRTRTIRWGVRRPSTKRVTTSPVTGVRRGALVRVRRPTCTNRVACFAAGAPGAVTSLVLPLERQHVSLRTHRDRILDIYL